MAVTQVTKGILIGGKLVTIQPLSSDGSLPTPIPDVIRVSDIKEIPIQTLIEQGERVVNRADGVGVISVDEEDDTLVGVDFDITMNLADFNAMQNIVGGTLQMDANNSIIQGITFPSITQQRNTPKKFQIDVYIPSYNVANILEGYIRHRFPFCRGVLKGLTHTNGEIAEPSLTVHARPHPTSEEIHEMSFVTILP